MDFWINGENVNLTARKEGKFIVINVDGKTVKYDLAEHKTYGFSGKEVKTLESQLRGITFKTFIGAFEDENYGRFLDYVRRCHRTHVSTISGVLKHVGDYASREQYFAAGLKNDDDARNIVVSEVPKRLLKFMREMPEDRFLHILRQHRRLPNAIGAVLNYDSEKLSNRQKYDILSFGAYSYQDSKYIQLIENLGYDATSLVNYIYRMITYEALEVRSIMQNLWDYASQSSKISAKYDKYPRNLLTTHAIASRNYARLIQSFNAQVFMQRIKLKMEKKIGEYSFIYPKSPDDIKDEAVQQNNCVASYIQRVIDGHCDIIFMREVDKPDKSLVTIEVRNGNHIVQALQAYNQPLTAEQQTVVNAYEAWLSEVA